MQSFPLTFNARDIKADVYARAAGRLRSDIVRKIEVDVENGKLVYALKIDTKGYLPGIVRIVAIDMKERFGDKFLETATMTPVDPHATASIDWTIDLS